MEDLTAHPRYPEALRHDRNAFRGWLGPDWEERKIREYLERRP